MGNANVADLSDPNRPTKLAEQFSELYDNEWTDAFEELEYMTDSGRISYLLHILQRAYELSSEIATSEWLRRCYYTTFTKHKDLELNVCAEDIKNSHDLNMVTTDQTEPSFRNDTKEQQQDPSSDTADFIIDIVQDSQAAESDMETQVPAIDAINEENEEQGTKDDDNLEQSADDNTASKNGQQMMGKGNSLNHDIEEILELTNDQQTSGNDNRFDPDNERKRNPDGETQMTKEEDSVDHIAEDKIADGSEAQTTKDEDSVDEVAEDNTVDDSEVQTIKDEDYVGKNAENNTADESEAQTTKDDNTVNIIAEDNTAANVDSTQVIPEGTSVDPVIDTTVENEEPERRAKLNSFEVPDKESKNKREQQAIKVFTHIKKKVLSSASTQIQNVITDCLVEEFSIPAQVETALIVFVKKCSEVCLMMGLKDPPLYIDFMKEGIPDQTLFINEQYKAYTRKGKYLQYVVWPCLFLEKNGPLLSKGTAQGRND